MTTLNSKKTAVQFNPALHAVGELKTEGGKIAALVKDLQTVQLRRRLDNPHNAEWTVKA